MAKWILREKWDSREMGRKVLKSRNKHIKRKNTRDFLGHYFIFNKIHETNKILGDKYDGC